MANGSNKKGIVLIVFLLLGLIFAYMVWQRAFKFACPPEMICTATTATNYYNEKAPSNKGKRPVGVCGTDQAPFCKFQDTDDDTDDDTPPTSGQGTNNQATLPEQGSGSSSQGSGSSSQGSASANVSGQSSGTASASGDGQSTTSTTSGQSASASRNSNSSIQTSS